MNIQHTASTSVCQSQSQTFLLAAKQKLRSQLQLVHHMRTLASWGRWQYCMRRSLLECKEGRWNVCVLCNNTVLNRQTETQREEGPAGNHPQGEYKPASWRDGEHKAPVAALQPHPSAPLLRFHIRGPHTGWWWLPSCAKPWLCSSSAWLCKRVSNLFVCFLLNLPTTDHFCRWSSINELALITYSLFLQYHCL